MGKKIGPASAVPIQQSEHYLFLSSGEVFAGFYPHLPMVKKIGPASAVPIQGDRDPVFRMYDLDVTQNRAAALTYGSPSDHAI